MKLVCEDSSFSLYLSTLLEQLALKRQKQAFQETFHGLEEINKVVEIECWEYSIENVV